MQNHPKLIHLPSKLQLFKTNPRGSMEWVQIVEPKTKELMYANLLTGECLWDQPNAPLYEVFHYPCLMMIKLKFSYNSFFDHSIPFSTKIIGKQF